MLRKKINFKLGSNLARWLVPGVAIGLLGFLSIAAFCPLQEKTVSAVDEMTLAAFLSPSITLSMSPSVSENIEPMVDGAFKNIATVARVQVMDSEYYDISISGNPDMVGAANPDAKIAAISGERLASEFENNTWGYAASKNSAGVTTAVAVDGNTAYAAVPATSTAIVSRQKTTNYTADDYYSLNFGAKVDTSIPADTYTSRVTVSVVASPVQAAEYSLTYDGNGATGGAVPSKQTASSYEENYEFTVVGNTGNLTKTGYTFLGWADSSSATMAQYAAGSKIMLAEDSPNKTIYAVWAANTNYSVTYNGNGNTSGTAPTAQTESNNNESQTFTAAAQGTLAKTGYTFQGWADTQAKANAGTVSYTAGAAITLQKSAPTVTLYAVWRAASLGSLTNMQELTVEVCAASATGETKQLIDTRMNADTSSTNKYWVTKLKDGNCWMTQNLDYAAAGTLLATGTAQASDTGKVWDVGLKVVTGFGQSAVAASGNYDAHYLVGNYYQQSAAESACPEGWELPMTKQEITVNGSYNKLLNGVSATQVIANPYYIIPAGRVDRSSGALGNAGTNGRYRSINAGFYLGITSTDVSPSANSIHSQDGYSVRCYVNGN